MSCVPWDFLIKKLAPVHVFLGQNPVFFNITMHSAQASPNGLFFAIPGHRVKGFDFIADALKQGVSGIVVEERLFFKARELFPEVTCVGVSDVSFAFAQAASLFFPQKPAFLAAVTGTNGKTSVAHFTRTLWGKLQKKAASFGTLGLCLEGLTLEVSQKFHENLTTPDPLVLSSSLDFLTSKGLQNCILEASSHGLDQKRLHGLKFQVGAFTSFSQDHLDYHPSLSDYWEAKTTLFKDLLTPGGTALLNGQLPHVETLESLCREKKINVWRYGQDGREITLLNLTADAACQQITFRFLGDEITLRLPFTGLFQAENFLAAFSIVFLSGVPVPDILKAAESLTPPPGRLEYIGRTEKGGDIYVDFAHTPDALQIVLTHLRSHTPGKIHLVFGCGGDRDQEKRLQMGKVASLLADYVIVTDDNPRTESPGHIRSQIMQGCPKAEEIEDRRAAIQKGIQKLEAGDFLLIAGKGHEAHQIIGNQIKDFDDRAIARQLIANLNREIN